jgi:DNA-directed RNA polymerase specialized sigma24 family protein
MPCTYYSDGELHRMTRDELDKATRLLCKMVNHFGIVPGDAELAAWKVDHDAMDAKRTAADQAERERRKIREEEREKRDALLARLSPEERKILGHDQ